MPRISGTSYLETLLPGSLPLQVLESQLLNKRQRSSERLHQVGSGVFDSTRETRQEVSISCPSYNDYTAAKTVDLWPTTTPCGSLTTWKPLFEGNSFPIQPSLTLRSKCAVTQRTSPLIRGMLCAHPVFTGEESVEQRSSGKGVLSLNWPIGMLGRPCAQTVTDRPIL